MDKKIFIEIIAINVMLRGKDVYAAWNVCSCAVCRVMGEYENDIKKLSVRSIYD